MIRAAVFSRMRPGARLFPHALLLGVFLAAGAAFGFGKNKVQYTDLAWRYHDLGNLHTFYHQEQGELPDITASWAQKAYAALQSDFHFTHRSPVPLLVYASPTLFEQTNVILEVIPEGVGGFTEIFKNRVVVPFTGSYEEFRHVIHHEMVHAFTFGILYDQLGGSLFRNSGASVPLWFAEGTAEYLSSGWDSEADMFMMDQTIHGSVPLPGPELGGYLAYKGGQSFLHYLAASRGDSAFVSFLHAFRNTRSVESAVKPVYKMSVTDLGKEWIRELKRIYWPEIGRRQNPADHADAVTTHAEDRSHFNLRPRISPNGEMIAFYSDAKDYTRILVTDRNGATITSIRQNGYGGYFESFQPFRSGLCWAPDNKRLAFVTKSRGRNEIRIVDISDKRLIKTISPPLRSIVSPDWSPDGTRLAFCGLHEDRMDIYVYDLQSDSLTAMTHSVMYESGPRFSRDSKKIVYAAQDTSGIADRKTPRPNFDLFLIDLAEKNPVRLTRTPWNEKDPVFTPNGADISYVSDQCGIDNVYIAPADSLDRARAVTDYVGGCSSPDWSFEGNTLVFCLFQKQGWDIWRMNKPYDQRIDSALALTNWIAHQRDSTVAFYVHRPLPSAANGDNDSAFAQAGRATAPDTSGIIEIPGPDSAAEASVGSHADSASRIDTAVARDMSEPLKIDTLKRAEHAADSAEAGTLAGGADEDADSAKAGLDTATVEDRPYRLRFSPDMATVGMGISTVYGYSGQGMIMLSDMLGNHRISLAGDIQGNLDEYFLYGSYLNSQHRLDFGASVSFSKSFTFESIYSSNLYHDANLGIAALVRYPFSIYSRLDFSGYFRKLDRKPYAFIDGSLEKDPSREESRLIILLPSLQYVFDNILWGITGPVNGIRARANVVFAPPADYTDVAFLSADADLRKYFHIARRFVLAARLSAGASAPFGKQRAARRFFLGGSENWIFGSYGVNLDNYEENLDNIVYSDIIAPFRGWNYFDLVGSRYAVANIEFRFPFIREINIAWPLPIRIRYINGAAFTDIGNAWDPEDQQKSIPLPRTIYGGIGFGFRANLGIFVLRYDRAWPTDWANYIDEPTDYFSLGAEF
jgi:Tol biopolymer transport system component